MMMRPYARSPISSTAKPNGLVTPSSAQATASSRFASPVRGAGWMKAKSPQPR